MHENRPPLGNDMYGAFGRDFATRDGRRVDGRRHQPQPVADARARHRRSRSTCRRWSAPSTPTSRKEEDRYRARDAHRRAADAVVRGAHPRRGAQGARRARRVLGSVPDVHAAARRRLAGVGPKNPVFGGRRPPGHRRAAHAGVAAAVPDRPAGRARAGAPAGHAHRRGARRRARAVDRPRSAACTTTGWSAGARVTRADDPVLADAGFADVARATITREQAERLAGCLDAEPTVLDTGELPLLWHWACFLPLVPTAALGADGHPRRRPEMDGVPAAHVGRRPGARRATARPRRPRRSASRGSCAPR